MFASARLLRHSTWQTTVWFRYTVGSSQGRNHSLWCYLRNTSSYSELHHATVTNLNLKDRFENSTVNSFLRRYMDPIRVPRIENWVPRISENCYRVRRIKEIGSIQVLTRYLTFSFKITCFQYNLLFNKNLWSVGFVLPTLTKNSSSANRPTKVLWTWQEANI